MWVTQNRPKNASVSQAGKEPEKRGMSAGRLLLLLR